MREIVGKERQVGGCPYNAIVLDDSVVFHTVEEWRNGADRLDPRLGGVLGLARRLRGRRCADCA